MTVSDSFMASQDHPSEALIELMAPDGYYKYLEVPKSSSPMESQDPSEDIKERDPLHPSIASLDSDLVKKQYRKLSRKHHPDRPGGDAATFRLLNRAQKVLLDPKLRHQYDILGIDLDDDDEVTDEGDEANHPDGQPSRSSTAQGIIQDIASTVLTSIMQLAVRTGKKDASFTLYGSDMIIILLKSFHPVMMGAVSVVLTKYRVTLYPALMFLAYIAYRIFQKAREPGGNTLDVLSPVLISTGLWAMHCGRLDTPAIRRVTWFFWFGEALVIGVFTYNSAGILPKTPLVMAAIATVSSLAALWFRGNVWNYLVVVGLELALALLVAMAFPVVELVLEAILNDKLRKIGDRVRAHHQALEAYYQQKLHQSTAKAKR